MVAPVEVVRGRRQIVLATDLGALLPDHRQPLRIGEGQRFDEHRVDDAGHRRGGAQPEGQDADDRGGEHR
ncbi:MAG: hypothetical protein KDD11_00225 [Acidobacteria bacterium]|nr:hypothetical protein [Acidobacteriota bacterium]